MRKQWYVRSFGGDWMRLKVEDGSPLNDMGLDPGQAWEDSANIGTEYKYEEVKPFDFQSQPDRELGLDEAVRQAIGAASVCWESMEHTGVFQEDQANEVAEALIAFVMQWSKVPNLGCATTKEIIAELEARLEGMDHPRAHPLLHQLNQAHALPMDVLEYRTVDDG